MSDKINQIVPLNEHTHLRAALLQHLKIINLAELAQRGDLPEDAKKELVEAVYALSELFSDEMPLKPDDPFDDVIKAALALGASQLLKESGIFRLYRFARTKDENGVPLYAQFETDDGKQVTTLNEFVSWYAVKAHTSRSLILRRFSLFDRLAYLGFSDEEIFQKALKFPTTLGNLLDNAFEWDSKAKEIVSVKEPAFNMVSSLVSEQAESEARTALIEGRLEDAIPIFSEAVDTMIEHVNAHESVKDAVKYAKEAVFFNRSTSFHFDPAIKAFVMTINITVSGGGVITHRTYVMVDEEEPAFEVIEELAKALHVNINKEELMDELPSLLDIYADSVYN